MGLFGGGTERLMAKLREIEQDIAGLHAKLDTLHAKADTAATVVATVDGHVADLADATAQTLQGVADQLLHLAAPAAAKPPVPVQVPAKTPGDPVVASGPAAPPAPAKGAPGRKA